MDMTQEQLVQRQINALSKYGNPHHKRLLHEMQLELLGIYDAELFEAVLAITVTCRWLGLDEGYSLNYYLNPPKDHRLMDLLYGNLLAA